jgi:hypothetical protein
VLHDPVHSKLLLSIASELDTSTQELSKMDPEVTGREKLLARKVSARNTVELEVSLV